MTREQHARRKDLLIAQSHLHRLQARLAWHDIREIVAPPHLAPPRGHVRSIATTLIGVGIPLLGLARMGRIMRVVSVGMMVMRIVRGFRTRR